MKRILIILILLIFISCKGRKYILEKINNSFLQTEICKGENKFLDYKYLKKDRKRIFKKYLLKHSFEGKTIYYIESISKNGNLDFSAMSSVFAENDKIIINYAVNTQDNKIEIISKKNGSFETEKKIIELIHRNKINRIDSLSKEDAYIPSGSLNLIKIVKIKDSKVRLIKCVSGFIIPPKALLPLIQNKK